MSRASMEVERVFHMNGGIGEMSYARNSYLQRKTREMVNHITISTVADLYLAEASQCLKIADLGCSSGPNSLSLLEQIISEIDERCHATSLQSPEIHVFLNDLPTNDFNSLFISLPSFIRSLSKVGRRDGPSTVFIAGIPGSFYGRLFPSNSLHFIHSSYCLHWLSKVPPGVFDENGKPIEKGKVYISRQSPPQVRKAYFEQFQEDFSLFLKSRSAELILGGRMLLIMLARSTSDHSDKSSTFLWDLLAEAFSVMISREEVEQNKVDTYKTHFYAPSAIEIEAEVKNEGSFVIDRLETFEGSSEGSIVNGTVIANAIRAIQEPMIIHHFGEGISEKLFDIFSELLDNRMLQEHPKAVSLIVVLQKNSLTSLIKKTA